MANQETNNNQQLYYAGIAAVVLVILIAVWLFFSKESTSPPAVNLLPPAMTQTLPDEPEPEPEAEPETVVTEPEPVATTMPETVTKPVQPDTPIPPLDQSDVEVKQRLLALDWRPGLANLFVTEDMLRRFTVQVDNIAQGQLAKGNMPLQPLEQRFALAEGAEMQLDESSFKRYEPYIQLLESASPANVVALFNRYEPLLQQAYAEQGYPDELFKNKLIAAIDMLLATPEVSYPLALKRPAVVYQFADPAIEQLPAAQKQMIRLGPVNQKRVKTLLKRYKQLLQ